MVGWLTHYDWLLQLHDEAIGRAPYLMDNKFQGDARLQDPVGSICLMVESCMLGLIVRRQDMDSSLDQTNRRIDAIGVTSLTQCQKEAR